MIKLNHFLLIAVAISLVVAEELKFSYTVSESTTQCFMSNLIFGSKAILTVKTGDNAKIMMTVNDPKGKEIERKMEPNKMTSEFDVQNEGSHQFCF